MTPVCHAGLFNKEARPKAHPRMGAHSFPDFTVMLKNPCQNGPLDPSERDRRHQRVERGATARQAALRAVFRAGIEMGHLTEQMFGSMIPG
jgi:hypothetical protein